MKSTSYRLILIASGALLFNFIFWNEKLGINTIVFDIFICTSVFFIFPYSIKSSISRWLFAGHIISAALVVFQNTIIAKISFSVTLLLFVSFSQFLHRSAWYAGGSTLLNYLLIIPNFFREIKRLSRPGINLHNWTKRFRLVIIPTLILLIFYIVYSSANAILYSLTAQINILVQNWFSKFFELFSPERILFFCFGFAIVGGLLLRGRSTLFSDADMKQEDNLIRKKTFFKKWKESAASDLLLMITGKGVIGNLALKNEFSTGLISMALLNILLLIINIIDVKYVWLGYTYQRDSSPSAYVHEGAGLLILSILLAMFVMLFFFRGNLNFYKKNKSLKFSAYLWILQNGFLVVSVLIRNYYYISHYGLAYKRLGLIFFLVMVMAGLATVFLKIYLTKTSYYLLRLNAWAVVFLLVLASFIDFDSAIAKYNIDRKSTVPVDVAFLLSLSDRTLPLIEANKDVIEADKLHSFYFKGNYFHSGIEWLQYREKDFLERQQQYSWLSWNMADATAKDALSAHKTFYRTSQNKN